MVLVMFGLLGLAPAALLYLMPGWKSYWAVIGVSILLYGMALGPVFEPPTCPEGMCPQAVFSFFTLIVSLPVTFVSLLVVAGIKYVKIRLAESKRPYDGGAAGR